jgi:hypothetical protein
MVPFMLTSLLSRRMKSREGTDQQKTAILRALMGYVVFFNFPIYLQSVEIHSDTFSKWCAGKRGRVEECSVAPLRNKRVKTLCGCQGKGVQAKENTN